MNSTQYAPLFAVAEIVDATPAPIASGCATEPAANEDFERDAA